MKFLRKINRGLILTVLVVLGVAVYLIASILLHNSAKPEIRRVCDQYIQTSVKYAMLPASYRKDKPKMPEQEVQNYLSDMQKDIGAFYPGGSQEFDYTVKGMKKDIQNQASGIGVVFDYQKKVVKYTNFDFDGNTVTATVSSNSKIDGYEDSSGNMETAGVRQQTASETTDTITLQKIDGQWKIVYADLQRPAKAENNEKYGMTVTADGKD